MAMNVTRDEIIDFALRYIPRDEITDFPGEGDLFCFLERSLPENKVLKDNEGWGFAGYGICKGYDYDYESKPKGKWLWFYFVSLNTFPPTQQTFKLQPPHIAKGIFQNSQRSGDIKIIKIPKYFLDIESNESLKEKIPDISENLGKDKIIQFPQKNRPRE